MIEKLKSFKEIIALIVVIIGATIAISNYFVLAKTYERDKLSFVTNETLQSKISCLTQSNNTLNSKLNKITNLVIEKEDLHRRINDFNNLLQTEGFRTPSY